MEKLPIYINGSRYSYFRDLTRSYVCASLLIYLNGEFE